MTRCLFDQVGGNGVLLSRHVARANVSHNEFVASGDSAVVSAGVADGIDGTAPTYPTGNTVSHNHVHDYGVYGKQTSCYFQALTANSSFVDNLCYAGPRAGLNYNDGTSVCHCPQTGEMLRMRGPLVRLLVPLRVMQ